MRTRRQANNEAAAAAQPAGGPPVFDGAALVDKLVKRNKKKKSTCPDLFEKMKVTLAQKATECIVQLGDGMSLKYIGNYRNLKSEISKMKKEGPLVPYLFEKLDQARYITNCPLVDEAIIGVVGNVKTVDEAARELSDANKEREVILGGRRYPAVYHGEALEAVCGTVVAIAPVAASSSVFEVVQKRKPEFAGLLRDELTKLAMRTQQTEMGLMISFTKELASNTKELGSNMGRMFEHHSRQLSVLATSQADTKARVDGHDDHLSTMQARVEGLDEELSTVHARLDVLERSAKKSHDDDDESAVGDLTLDDSDDEIDLR